MNKRICTLIIFFSCFLHLLPAQTTVGMTGLLTLPSAYMQPDKTVMAGGNFLNKEVTPSSFNYHTFNYYLNITILPFLEVGYSCTLFKATDKFVPSKKGKFVNQDRSLSARLRLLKEGRYYPSVVLGGNDITDSFLTSSPGNSYYSGIYLAATKHFTIKKETLGIHLAYTYTRRKDACVKDISLGVTYTPSFAPALNLIAEATRTDLNIGATYLFFHHLYLQTLLQKGKYFSGGVGYKIYL